MQFFLPAKNTQHTPVTTLHSEKIKLVPIYEECLEWGSFDEEQMQYAKTALTKLAEDSIFSVIEANPEIVFWLHIPPLPNKDAAIREINKLRNLGIVSYRVKDDASWNNAVSLGTFYNKSDALKQLNELESKGVANAAIDERRVTLKKFLIYSPTFVIREQIQKLAEQFEGTLLIQNQCERL